MRPLIWVQWGAAALTAALLASPALAQKGPPPGVDDLAGPPPNGGFPIAVDPPPAPPTPAIMTDVVWLERPNARDFARYYPEAAYQANVSGRAVLDCIVTADGRIACTVASEEPAGYGFGEAALRISTHFRMALQTRDGRPTRSGRVRLPIRFVLADEPPAPAPQR